MKKIIAATVILLALNHGASSQWRKIADFPSLNGDEYVTCVYFIDLPGPPRIGFVGTESELWKTTDGGKSWRSVWDSGGAYDGYYVTDVCFKDTLTGWFSIIGDSNACYKTTDGGETWVPLHVTGSSIYGAHDVYYCSGTNRLFLAMASYIATKVSTDLGATWQDALPPNGVVDITINFSFSSALNGIGVGGFYPDNLDGYIVTSNGGVSWDTVVSNVANGYPLAIPGTSTLFDADYSQVIVRRSDDFGHTWRQISNIPSNVDSFGTLIGPWGTGFIKGNFSRLYIQTDTGMFVSVDSGVTWNFDGGPTYLTNFSNDEFYSADGVTIAGETYNQYGGIYGGGLWEEDWPQAGVAESATANSNNALSVFPNPATNSITIESANGPVSILDPLGRNYTTPQPPPPIESRAGPWKGGGVSIDISMLPSGVYFVSDGYSRSKFVKE